MSKEKIKVLHTEKLEYYRNRKLSGRQKHNAKWMAIYNDFVIGYENGMKVLKHTIVLNNHVCYTVNM